MSEFDVLSIAAGGMGMQRTMLDVAARNVAAAQASDARHAYPRLIAQFAQRDPYDIALENAGESDAGDDGMRFIGTRTAEPSDALTEMVAMLDAQRAYEADASVFDVGKKLAEHTLEIGRF